MARAGGNGSAACADPRPFNAAVANPVNPQIPVRKKERRSGVRVNMAESDNEWDGGLDESFSDERSQPIVQPSSQAAGFLPALEFAQGKAVVLYSQVVVSGVVHLRSGPVQKA